MWVPVSLTLRCRPPTTCPRTSEASDCEIMNMMSGIRSFLKKIGKSYGFHALYSQRVSPRTLRALRPAGFPHRRSITESERGSYPHRLVPSGFPDTAFASPVSPRALRALRPAGFPHTRSAATFSKKSQKNAIFSTQKDHPAPQKLKFCTKKNVVFLLKKTSQPRKKLNFCMKK